MNPAHESPLVGKEVFALIDSVLDLRRDGETTTQSGDIVTVACAGYVCLSRHGIPEEKGSLMADFLCFLFDEMRRWLFCEGYEAAAR